VCVLDCVWVCICVCVHMCVKTPLFLIDGKLCRVWKIQGHWSPVTCGVCERACVIECLWECLCVSVSLSLSLSLSLTGYVTEKEALGKEQRISSGFPSMYGKGDCVSAWLWVIPSLCWRKDSCASEEIMAMTAEWCWSNRLHAALQLCSIYCAYLVSSFIFRLHRFRFIHTTFHHY